MVPDHSPLFKNWQTDMSLAPKDGSSFMGRQKGTNKAFAVHWGCETQKWYHSGPFSAGNSNPVELCQWITFSDFADIRTCAWRRG